MITKKIALILVLFLEGCTLQNKINNPQDAVFSKHAPTVFKVLLETGKGDILIEVTRQWSPNGADRFYNLVRQGYYDNTAVFRVRAGVWVQFGIAASPKVAQVWRYKTIPDDPRTQSNVRGTVDYAFKDPDGRSTQVFINLRDNSAAHDTIPFVPFGKVIQGLAVADALYAGYGEKSGGGIRAGKQDDVFAGGNKYLRYNFPLLDYIKRARVVSR